MLPGTLAAVNTEILVNLGVAVVFLGLFLLPWVDRRQDEQAGVGQVVLRFTGIVILVYILASIILTCVGL